MVYNLKFLWLVYIPLDAVRGREGERCNVSIPSHNLLILIINTQGIASAATSSDTWNYQRGSYRKSKIKSHKEMIHT